MSKIRVGILFGGKSVEHEVSLQSAKNIVEAINKDKYEVVLIGIDKEGKWHLSDTSKYLLNESNPRLISLNASNQGIGLVPGETQKGLINTETYSSIGNLDVIFPIIHGATGIIFFAWDLKMVLPSVT